MERTNFAVLVGSVASGSILFAGFLYQNLVAIPVGSIFLTAILAYYFQKRSDENVSRLERRKLAATEAIGPLHGELLKIIAILERNKRLLMLDDPIITKVWNDLRSDYRIYLIPSGLRDQCETFYSKLENFHVEAITKKIDDIRQTMSYDNIESLLPKGFRIDVNDQPSFHVKQEDGSVKRCSLLALVFWKGMPTQQHRGELSSVIVPEYASVPGYGKEKELSGSDAVNFVAAYMNELWNATDKSQGVTEARLLHSKLLEDASALRDALRDEIQKWTE